MKNFEEIAKLPIVDLLPHRPPMLLLDEACGMEGDCFKTRVRITSESPFCTGGEVPAWVGLEYMAQTVAAYSGVMGLAKGGSVRVGMLLGTREYVAETAAFTAGQELEVLARLDIFQEHGVGSMDCFIRAADGKVLAKAQIAVIDLPDLKQFLKDRSA